MLLTLIVSMPSRASTSFLLLQYRQHDHFPNDVSMPSRASTSFLLESSVLTLLIHNLCQCPHGLVPHFYKARSLRDKGYTLLCQCPHGLVPHFYVDSRLHISRPILSRCQCPHGLVPHFYEKKKKKKKKRKIRVSMPSRASTSFLLC